MRKKNIGSHANDKPKNFVYEDISLDRDLLQRLPVDGG